MLVIKLNSSLSELSEIESVTEIRAEQIRYRNPSRTDSNLIESVLLRFQKFEQISVGKTVCTESCQLFSAS